MNHTNTKINKNNFEIIESQTDSNEHTHTQLILSMQTQIMEKAKECVR